MKLAQKISALQILVLVVQYSLYYWYHLHSHSHDSLLQAMTTETL